MSTILYTLKITQDTIIYIGISTLWHYPWICIYEGANITVALTGTSQAIYTSQVIHVHIHNVLYSSKYEQGYLWQILFYFHTSWTQKSGKYVINLFSKLLVQYLQWRMAKNCSVDGGKCWKYIFFMMFQLSLTNVFSICT